MTGHAETHYCMRIIDPARYQVAQCACIHAKFRLLNCDSVPTNMRSKSWARKGNVGRTLVIILLMACALVSDQALELQEEARQAASERRQQMLLQILQPAARERCVILFLPTSPDVYFLMAIVIMIDA